MKVLLKPVLLAFAFVALSASVFAQPARYIEGTHYVALDAPVRTVDPNKIEVVEIFWYGCTHCYSFEPLIENWEANAAEDVAFVRSPGMWNAMMQTHAQLYYTSVELGVFEETHNEIFDEILLRANYLQSEAAAKDYFTGKGVSGADFDAAWNSFTVTSAVNRANTNMRDYGVRSTPNLIVNGKYRIVTNQAVPTQTDMLEVVDYLVEMERSNM
ncbi:MAG: thiol:disulfide interchange protein DsbA/DsbL [Gammaproteobacteria bacterium]|jgi:protein dithiol oxidoreductase (disulfide-forming)|nr:thiol:disulfide interchange protein DsbA/DsbL [Gammaproteobacteria bacterium]MDG2090123.1 thiol:disulfide interchange protein DsbA/DsbL [Gammaproteobacteria bacterium]